MFETHTTDCYRLAASLGIEPFYVVTPLSDYLSATEHRLIAASRRRGILAFASPTSDLMHKTGSLKYEWRGRGCCVVFCRSSLEMSAERLLGITIHEIAHWLDDFDNPARDDADHQRAVKADWHNMQPESKHHSRRWLKACVHLWHRANQAGFKCSLVGDTLDPERYGYTVDDLLPLMAKAEAKAHVPIESLLHRSTRKIKRNSKSKPVATSSTGSSPDIYSSDFLVPGSYSMHGELVERVPDGYVWRGRKFLVLKSLERQIRHQHAVA